MAQTTSGTEQLHTLETSTRTGIRYSIVVPAYNEEAGIPVILKKILASVDGDHEVLVVDDGSTDGTCSLASEFPCRVVRHAKNRGKGAALRTGARHASGQYVLFIDADDTYPAEALPRIHPRNKPSAGSGKGNPADETLAHP